MNRVGDTRRPILAAALPYVWLGPGALAWDGTTPFALDAATVLALPHLDGTVSLETVVDDAASVLGASSRDDLLERVAADLQDLSRSSVVHLDREAPPPGGVSTLVSVDQDEGITTTVETLPDGRMRRTTKLIVESNSSTDELAKILRGAALTDVLGADNCVGSKLRAGEPAADLLIDLGNERTRVRVDHPESLAALREFLGAAVVNETELVVAADDDTAGVGNERSGVGVSAYVIAPLEGQGAPRVYDQWGARAGRPIGTAEVTQLVGHLLVGQRPNESDGVPVRSFAVETARGVVLLREDFRDLPQLHRRLRAAGLRPLDVRELRLHGDVSVRFSTGWPGEASRSEAVVGVVALASDERAPELQAGVELLSTVRAEGAEAIQGALGVVASTLTLTDVVVAERQLESVLAAVEGLLSSAG